MSPGKCKGNCLNYCKTGFTSLREKSEIQGKGRKIQKIRENLENSGNFVWKSEASGKA